MEEIFKFCPECGNALEKSPIGSSMSCFLHGEFVSADKNSIRWNSYALYNYNKPCEKCQQPLGEPWHHYRCSN